MSSAPQQLSCIELTVAYMVFTGVGYWIGGPVGAACGAGLLTLLCVRLVWLASRSPAG